MNNDLLLSFIIPAYNVEPYIEECLSSILKLNIAKEVIVVNDGSTDSTLEKLKKIQQNNSSVIIIDQVNQRQAAARNNALDIAKGKYIYLTDADDYILTDSFEKFFNSTIELDSDIGVCLFDNQKSFTVTKRFYPGMSKAFKEKKTLSGPEFIENTLQSKSYGAEVCLYLFKADILKQIRFPADMKKHEDDFFIAEALITAKKVNFFNDSVYFRRYREGSVSRAANDVPSRSIPDILKNIHHFRSQAKANPGQQVEKIFSTLALRSLISIVDYLKYGVSDVNLDIWNEYKEMSKFKFLKGWRMRFYKTFLKHKLR